MFKEQIFVLMMALSPTDQHLIEAEAIEFFNTDFECSEVETDMEDMNPDLHFFCIPVGVAVRLKAGILDHG